jgi:hypothetical protein
MVRGERRSWQTAEGLMMLTLMRSPDLWTATVSAWPWVCVEAEPEPPAQADLRTVSRLLDTFEPITLAQMDDVALLDRSEIKYVLPQSLLSPVLAELRDAYRVLVVAGQPFSRYRTLYFDTADLALYRRHHAGAPNHYKVRAREYVDSCAAFLEVKHKVGGRHTIKSRIPTDGLVTALTFQAADFLADTCPYMPDELVACLWNHYTRITLVSKQRAERITLDLNLAYIRGAERASLPGIVVAEVKYRGAPSASEFARLMRARHVRGTSFSKYCMGVSWLFPNVKHNKFKAKQRLVARLAQGINDELY